MPVPPPVSLTLQSLLSRHILRSSATEPSDILLRAVLQDHDIIPDVTEVESSAVTEGESAAPGSSSSSCQQAEADAASEPARQTGNAHAHPPLSPSPSPSRAECASLVKELPGGVRERVEWMVESVEGKDVEAALKAMEAVAERDVGVRTKRMDKKGERSALFGLKKVGGCHPLGDGCSAREHGMGPLFSEQEWRIF